MKTTNHRVNHQDSSPVGAQRLLVVCTFNICRSPLAAALTVHHAGLSSGALVIETAGTETATDEFGGFPACPEMVEGLRMRFPDLSAYQTLSTHASSQINVTAIEQADIILVMERHQRSQVVRMLPSAQRKTFLLSQAARLSTWIRSQENLVRAGGFSIVDALDDARGLAPYLEDVDVEDPHRTGGPLHASMIAQVDAASHSIALLIRGVVHPEI